MRWIFRFRESSAAQWALLTAIIGIVVMAAIPAFERVMQFADEVEFRYLANAFEGSAKNVQLRAALKNEIKQKDIVTVEDVSFRLNSTDDHQQGFPFALENGAKTLTALRAEDCGALLEQFTDQSYWLDDRFQAAVEQISQPKIRAIVVRENGIEAQPYCRFERPVRAGIWSDDTSISARHVFAYYPASGRVEVLREIGEIK
ncbi:hypothetical protein K6Q96_01615 [Grimontia kaedaensis]|uniref:Uncharacterized protein n=1 Tax=Grimontia kaedaensis TaxID=2872157 RepID=A0ABY4WU16_9GAMM|nr:hypothetical protein [Grimontia kaedaensis]USH02765.1 hypothetical protein K6Q96_01615 [Grimontia kaedaensis]